MAGGGNGNGTIRSESQPKRCPQSCRAEGKSCLRSEKNVVVVTLEVQALFEPGDTSVTDVGALRYQIFVSAPCSPVRQEKHNTDVNKGEQIYHDDDRQDPHVELAPETFLSFGINVGRSPECSAIVHGGRSGILDCAHVACGSVECQQGDCHR